MVLGSVAKVALSAVVLTSALPGCGRTQENPQDPREQPGPGGVPTTNGGMPTAMPLPVAGGGNSSGSIQGGNAGAAGATTDPSPNVGGQPANNAAWPSLGCDRPALQVAGAWQLYSVHVTGATLDPTFTVAEHDRAYGVWLPKGYDPSQPYRTVYLAHCGSNGTGDSRYTSTTEGDPNVIYVGLASGTPNFNDCYDNSGLQSTEWEYFGLVAGEVEGAFCVDKNAELVAGQGLGGTLANMLGCYFSGIDPARTFGPNISVRAQYAVVAPLPKNLPACGGPVAGLWLHDPGEYLPIADSRASLDRVLTQNGCADSVTTDWGTGSIAGIGCKKYLGCPAEYPVVFCETPGHGKQGNYFSITVPAEKQFAAELSPH